MVNYYETNRKLKTTLLYTYVINDNLQNCINIVIYLVKLSF